MIINSRMPSSDTNHSKNDEPSSKLMRQTTEIRSSSPPSIGDDAQTRNYPWAQDYQHYWSAAPRWAVLDVCGCLQKASTIKTTALPAMKSMLWPGVTFKTNSQQAVAPIGETAALAIVADEISQASGSTSNRMVWFSRLSIKDVICSIEIDTSKAHPQERLLLAWIYCPFGRFYRSIPSGHHLNVTSQGKHRHEARALWTRVYVNVMLERQQWCHRLEGTCQREA